MISFYILLPGVRFISSYLLSVVTLILGKDLFTSFKMGTLLFDGHHKSKKKAGTLGRVPALEDQKQYATDNSGERTRSKR